ncbi:MAG TPA: rhamnulokinase family protein [Candidatus Acidoferrum sp.]
MSETFGGFTYLAFDLGAESGRAILGRFHSGRLSIEEIGRFRNEPVINNGGLHWDVPRLWHEMRSILSSIGPRGVERLDGIGVDTWGVDYALLGQNGALLENPFHYRDTRTEGLMQRALKILTPEIVYSITGIQFLPFNTLYQLYATQLLTPRTLEMAKHFVTVPDLFHFWLTGKILCERTNASTTQFLDVHKREWSLELLHKLGIPAHMLPPLVDAGTILGNVLPELTGGMDALSGTPVIAPASHDTASAFAAVHSGKNVALISSGTWSLLGTELAGPVVTDEARRLNFTNEGGVGGTVRLLKNICGLWLLERCRKDWQSEGRAIEYQELLAQAAAEPPLQFLVNPDDRSFVLPQHMPQAIAAFCAKSRQSKPLGPGPVTRTILESLTLKYRQVLESLERLVGTKFQEIRIVGGGSRIDLLNQFTADAIGRRVLAGPVEATALGNLAMQMVATGAVASLSEARDLISTSFPPRVFEPKDTDRWGEAFERFQSFSTNSTD